jgi:hypothetical protein
VSPAGLRIALTIPTVLVVQDTFGGSNINNGRDGSPASSI